MPHHILLFLVYSFNVNRAFNGLEGDNDAPFNQLPSHVGIKPHGEDGNITSSKIVHSSGEMAFVATSVRICLVVEHTAIVVDCRPRPAGQHRLKTGDDNTLLSLFL